MPGPVKKPADRRQRRNKPRELQVIRGGEVVVPDLPHDDLLPSTVEAWEAYWRSPLAESVELATDLPAVRRLFEKRDEYDRAYREFRKERMVEGSMGQPVLSPMGKVMKDLESDIRQLEDRLGLSPKARAQLGITIGQAKRTLDDLNRALEVGDLDDPRLEIADEA